MVKLTVLYGQPKDAVHFERYYLETHTPIALRVKGVRRFEIAKVTGTERCSAALLPACRSLF